MRTFHDSERAETFFFGRRGEASGCSTSPRPPGPCSERAGGNEADTSSQDQGGRERRRAIDKLAGGVGHCRAVLAVQQ